MSPEQSPGTIELAPDACWALLRTSDVGRLAVVVDSRPEIFPVNFAVDHGTVVLRTAQGPKLSAALEAPVAFEVDGYEAGTAEAWSVVVKGHARQLRGTDELIDTVGIPLSPWHRTAKPQFLRITPDELTGRRFVRAPAGTWDTPITGTRPTAPE
ncbi:MAG: flavin-nucleotide-binding protein [Frankiales bacterium]|jgi:hypothetical protein|nr:flavin-nucleotide-binding protein [Frankiales bacterium]